METFECECCDKEGVHAMSNGEYHYCAEHYKPIAICECCGIEIHEDWDCGPAGCCEAWFCRPCGKQHACEEDEEDEEGSGSESE
jgi:hypothetical protein